MTARERAERIIGSLANYPGIGEHFRREWELAYDVDVNLIATALADERQLVWEEAAKMAEEKAERSIKGEHLNIPEYNFGYRGGLRGLADEIRLKLYAKAHAGQEG